MSHHPWWYLPTWGTELTWLSELGSTELTVGLGELKSSFLT